MATLVSTSQPGVPQPAQLPLALPKTQADWQAFVNALSTWRPQPPAWQNLTLLNGWEAYSSAWAPPQYQVDLSGRLYLRGLIKPGTVTDGTTLLTLPVAPSFQPLTLAQAHSGSAYSPVRLDVQKSGNLIIYEASSFTSSGFVSLDQLSFSLAQ